MNLEGGPAGDCARDALPAVHHTPSGLARPRRAGLHAAASLVCRHVFRQRYGHRAIVLETVAAVPGMVGATVMHLQCLRRMVDDDGWTRTLLEEAENERMHLMTFIEIARPTGFERLVVLITQWLFYVGYFLLYLVSQRTAHRVVGYFEEEAVLSYTLYLAELDAGRSPNVAAPAIAKHYWKLAPDATRPENGVAVPVPRSDLARHAATVPDPCHTSAGAMALR